jgi:very-short-patch-repair endonuclease
VVGQLIAERAARQHGVISVLQLRELGLNHSAVSRRLAAGLLHPLHRGVYSVGIPHVSFQGRYLAAVLASGPEAALSHRGAGDLWGIRPNDAGHIEITVPRTRVRVPGVRVHRSRMMDPRDFTSIDGIRVTSLARTLLDLSAVVKPQDLEVAIDRAERLRIFDLGAVVEVLERAHGRRGARALRRAIAAYEPSTQKSELERRFKELVQRSGLSMPSFNAAVDGERATHEVDAFWAEERLAVQLDGFEFHRTRRDRERDADSDADLELVGHRVMRLTWDDVAVHGERTLRRIRVAGA